MFHIIYEGNLRCSANHNQSGSRIETDAPTDNKGKGERFSPTDLVCVSLATCIATTLAIKTENLGLDLSGMDLKTEKVMVNDPRRIEKILIMIHFPEGRKFSEDHKLLMDKIARECPVMLSLNSNIEKHISWHWA